MQLTPAAIKALANNDIDNFLTAVIPGGIEAQEAQGQRDLINSSQLPLDIGRNITWEQLANLGIVRGEQVDDLFVNVTLPIGWYKKPTEHNVWSNLIDEQGRIRAGIFYKAAFYDRHAHFSLTTRYNYGVQPIVENDWDGPHYGTVTDQSKVIWRTDKQLIRNDNLTGYYKESDTLEKEARIWIENHYPDYRNPLAYW